MQKTVRAFREENAYKQKLVDQHYNQQAAVLERLFQNHLSEMAGKKNQQKGQMQVAVAAVVNYKNKTEQAEALVVAFVDAHNKMHARHQTEHDLLKRQQQLVGGVSEEDLAEHQSEFEGKVDELKDTYRKQLQEVEEGVTAPQVVETELGQEHVAKVLHAKHAEIVGQHQQMSSLVERQKERIEELHAIAHLQGKQMTDENVRLVKLVMHNIDTLRVLLDIQLEARKGRNQLQAVERQVLAAESMALVLTEATGLTGARLVDLKTAISTQAKNIMIEVEKAKRHNEKQIERVSAADTAFRDNMELLHNSKGKICIDKFSKCNDSQVVCLGQLTTCISDTLLVRSQLATTTQKLMNVMA